MPLNHNTIQNTQINTPLSDFKIQGTDVSNMDTPFRPSQIKIHHILNKYLFMVKTLLITNIIHIFFRLY